MDQVIQREATLSSRVQGCPNPADTVVEYKFKENSSVRSDGYVESRPTISDVIDEDILRFLWNGTDKVSSRDSERAASMMRRPSWSGFLQGEEARPAEYEAKSLLVHDDVEFATVMDQVKQGDTQLEKFSEVIGTVG